MKNYLVILFGVMLVSFWVIAVHAKQKTSPATTLTIAMAIEPDNLYIYDGTSLNEQNIQQAIMDGPIDNRGYATQPVILEKLPSFHDGDAITKTVIVQTGEPYISPFDEITIANSPISATQLFVTYTLKSNLLWADGQPLTTADSIFGYDIACHPDSLTSKYFCQRTNNYLAINTQTIIWSSLPYINWQDVAYTQHFWTPLPQHILNGVPPIDIPNSTYARDPLGWGPYQLDEWIAGEKISLSRNPLYWQPDSPNIDQLNIIFIPDPKQALSALLNNEVDVITQDLVDSTEWDTYLALQANGQLSLHGSTVPIIEYIHFGIMPADERYNFFDDVQVRQAITLCTDRQTMMNVTYSGLSMVSDLYAPPDHPLSILSNPTHWPYDPAEGQALLNIAGWVVGNDGWRYKDGQKFEITYQTTNNNPTRQQIAEMFQANMIACGIEVHLLYLPAKQFFADGPDGPIFGRKFDLAQFAWLTGTPPPCDLYITNQIPTDPNWEGYNVTGYSNPVYDTDCQNGLTYLPGTTQYTTTHINAMQIYANDLPTIPLFPRIRVVLSRPNINGIKPDPTQVTEMWNVEDWNINYQISLPILFK